MKSAENPERPQLDGRSAMEDLTLGVELRYGEAIARQMRDPQLVWLMAGIDAETEEEIAWYRIGESTELLGRGLETLDIGILVVDSSLDAPVPLHQESAEQHFYVSKPQLKSPRLRVSERNSLSVLERRRRRVRHGVDLTPISDLSRKLNGPDLLGKLKSPSYPLRPLRVRREG